jgi:mannose/fructose/N-acetylgalactosamine-specific phosphotransferase system component IIB
VNLLMVRVDDRLIHGQVTQGWGSVLHPQRLVLVNDAVAESAWERDLYLASAPEGMTVSVLSVQEAPSLIARWIERSERLIVLVESPGDALRLYRGGMLFERLNVGGLHFREGRREVLPYVYVDREDRQALEHLRDQGVTVECADVPGCERKDFFECLESRPNGT